MGELSEMSYSDRGTGGPVDLDLVFDDMFCEDEEDGDKIASSSRSKDTRSVHHHHHGATAAAPEAAIVGDTGCYEIKKEDSNGKQRSCNKKSKFRFVRAKFFKSKHPTKDAASAGAAEDSNPLEETVVFDDILDSSPERPIRATRDETDRNHVHGGSHVARDLFTKRVGCSAKPPQISEKDIHPIFRGGSLKKSISTKKEAGAIHPPIAEIHGHRRKNSDASDISSLSGTKDNPLEFSLSNNGFREESPYMASLTEDIMMQLMERRRNLAAAATAAPRSNDTSGLMAQNSIPTTQSKCFILLTNPMKRIFEIVPASYEPLKTTVGDILIEVPNMATDHRLKKQIYVGIAYQGLHLPLKTIPSDAIQDSLEKRTPLMAIPAHFSAAQMELVGNSLMENPPVRKLLEDQLASLEATTTMTTTAAAPTRASPLDVVNDDHNPVDSSSPSKSVLCTPSGSLGVEI
eukprot:scaffold1426_cov83-Cylindrotheca_fusiformis.AAC.5